MSETLKALDQFFAKILINISSSKVWATAGGMILSAWLGYQTGGFEGMIIGIAGVLGLPITYTISKTYQNTHGANAVSQSNQQTSSNIQTQAQTESGSSASFLPTDQTSTALAPQPATVTPFNKEAFMQTVNEQVEKRYGVRNACTTFFTAQAVFNSMSFDNRQAWYDAKEFLKYLGGQAFKEVWGMSYDDAVASISIPDAHGCTYPSLEFKAIQLGMEYYFILLEYRNLLNT